MANEENINVDIENQGNFEKKKRIAIICLSVVVFVTLIVGLFFAKKNKESSYDENNDIGKVVNENNKNTENNNDSNNENEKPKNNKIVIVNKNDYFFNKTSGQAAINILSLIAIGILFFFLENNRLKHIKKKEASNNINDVNDVNKNKNVDLKFKILHSFTDLFMLKNLYGLLSLVNFVIVVIPVEFILNHLLIGSAAHFFSKDKSKGYFHTLSMSVKKRVQFFSSFFIELIYLLYAFAVAIVVRLELCACQKQEDNK